MYYSLSDTGILGKKEIRVLLSRVKPKTYLSCLYRIRGAYLVKPYIETEVYEKTKRKGALAEEAARVASGMSRTLASAMAQKAPAPSKQGKADAKTKVSNVISQM